ncbi:PH domain-containing protein [Brevibacterium litoralis]|uniref:PH domain-containing protein n=1 Tax=Brevibacterium litoralis TaxID=3138935 RepID=UPI0032EAABB1
MDTDDTVDTHAGDPTWHRVHPMTPFLQAWVGLVAAVGGIAAGFQNTIQGLIEALVRGRPLSEVEGIGWVASHSWVLLLILGGIVAVVVLVGLVSWLSWRALGYRVDDTNVYLRHGILTKEHKQARMDRVQSVDVNQPFVPRLLGFAAVTFDVAGGKGSSVDIRFLRKARAEELREEMLGLVRAAKVERTGDPSAPAAPEEGTDARPGQGSSAAGLSGVVEETAETVAADFGATIHDLLVPYGVRIRPDEDGQLVRAPAHRVVLARVLSEEMLVMAFFALLAIGGVITLLALGMVEVAIPVLFSVLFPLGAFTFGFFKGGIDNANFTVRVTEDGLAVSRGLTSTVRRTLPLDRVQAVRIRQPLLWRKADWWEVTFNTAGGGGNEDGSGTSGNDNVLFPVGTREEALTLAALALPDPGLDAEAVEASSLYSSAMYWTRSSDPHASAAEALFRPHSPRARILDWLTWRRNGFVVTDTTLVIRAGRLTREVVVVPHARVQSMALHDGPLRRALGLGDVRLHSTAGPVNAQLNHLDAEVAREFFLTHAETTWAARHRMDAGTEPAPAGVRAPA